MTASRLTPETLKGVMAEIKSGFYSVDDLTVQLPRFKIEQTHELRQVPKKLQKPSSEKETCDNFSWLIFFAIPF